MTQDPVLSRLKLIGEPWDIGPGGYQVGGFPPGWGEWNDKYRDTVREYWKGDNVSTTLPRGCWAPAICTICAGVARGPASTSSPPTTALR
jgi:hypothetical protein